jgi:SNF2-related domain/Phage-integrase repeat unit
VKFRPFAEAREFVHKRELTSKEDWSKYCKSGKPLDMPTDPSKSSQYKNNWKGWGDWLGTGTTALQHRKYRSFAEAREFVCKLGLKNQSEWRKYCKSGNKPTDIPANPALAYKKDWKGYGYWFGTGYIAPWEREYKSFTEARKFVHTLHLKSSDEWKIYCKSGKRPKFIPSNPASHYKEEWKGMGDWLGTGVIANQDKEYMSFADARKFTHTLGLKSQKEWQKYLISGKRPQNIPTYPKGAYKKEWKGYADWLGTGVIANQDKEYMSFADARKFTHTLGLKSQNDWYEYCKSGNKPSNIPFNPDQKYKEDWRDFADWLGYENPEWVVRKVKDLLRNLIESKIIYRWDEAVLYSFLLRKGLLNLGDTNRHSQFFKNIIQASRTQEGVKAIEEYANSDSEIPPDLSKFKDNDEGQPEEEIESASAQELSSLIENADPLDYGKIKTAKQILAQTNVLESINVDEEAMQFYLDYSIDELWKSAFRDTESAVVAVKQEGKNGNRYHDTVVETFLTDYEGIQNIKVPSGYSFPYPPTLMQLYVAYKVKTNQYFGNFSGTGAGKTLSAVLASRVIDSKMTLIVCPNDVVGQWQKNILEIFPDSIVTTGKEAFYQKYDENKHQYLVLNYDKFSQEDSPNLILNLAKQKVDFVVLDEIHFVKKRDEESSQRRKNLDGLMTAVRKKNSNVKVLGLSATPVVNNLMEGRSLLELVTGKVYDDVATTPTIPNAVTLYEKLSLVSIRELPKYDVDVHTEHIDVKTQIQQNDGISIKELKSNPLTIERFLSDAKIPEIIRRIECQTIIYTEYVTDIIENCRML